ncbi:hypothetical protein J2D73_16825 [Acetobacter sacchari]|uniref:Uncharacterized protein n=1 Tax=Acetobacter sacchari TaxID=2661687 RepID=A0ABS3LZU7_9PROT|nr:hypothetical protein [Acetobacter sacchari]MBO1361451.1 hypothetical protein [Acetobacter sacchari]
MPAQDTTAVATVDRELGRLEGRVESLEKTVERLETSVNGLISVIDFAKNGIKIVWWAIGLIGLDGVVRALAFLAHLVRP